MARLWVGGLEVGISERDLEDEVRSCSRCKPIDTQQHTSLAAVHKVRQTEECMGREKGMLGSMLENRLYRLDTDFSFLVQPPGFGERCRVLVRQRPSAAPGEY